MLEHLLKKENAAQVFYSDVDILDPDIETDFVRCSIESYGVVFAQARLKDDEGVPYSTFENGFLGFSKTMLPFISLSLSS